MSPGLALFVGLISGGLIGYIAAVIMFFAKWGPGDD